MASVTTKSARSLKASPKRAKAQVTLTTQATVGELIGFVASGQVKIQVGKVLPLSQAAQAHRLLEGRQTTGKVVLQPWAEA